MQRNCLRQYFLPVRRYNITNVNTKFMKGRTLIITSTLVLLVGVALLFAYQAVHAQDVVTVGAVLFILAGIFNVVSFDSAKRKAHESKGAITTTFNWITSAAAVILGLCMLLFRSTFVSLVPVMFGILIAFMAFYQLYILAIGIRPVVLPAWLYITPMVLAALAVYLFMQRPVDSDSSIMLITGISLAFFGVMGIIEGSLLGNANHKIKVEEEKKANETVPLDESTPAVEKKEEKKDEKENEKKEEKTSSEKEKTSSATETKA